MKKEKSIAELLKMDFKKSILSNIILQVLFLIFGIVIFKNPYITARAAGVCAGIYFILLGIGGIIEYFTNSPIFTYNIFSSILSVILGIIVMVISPDKITRILTFTLGLYLIMISIFKILKAIKLKNYGYDGWGVILATSIIILVFGVFVTINPLSSMDIVEVAGIFIILFSILEICNLIMVYFRAIEIMKLFKKD